MEIREGSEVSVAFTGQLPQRGKVVRVTEHNGSVFYSIFMSGTTEGPFIPGFESGRVRLVPSLEQLAEAAE